MLYQSHHYMLLSALDILCRYVCLSTLGSYVKPQLQEHLENVVFRCPSSIKQEVHVRIDWSIERVFSTLSL